MGFNEFRVKIMIFRKFILFSLKQRLFFCARPTHVGARQGAQPLTKSGSATCGLRD